MIERTKCPVTGGPSRVVFSRPYTLPRLREAAERYGLLEALRERPFEIRQAADSGVHFQTWVADEEELKRIYSPSVNAETFRQSAARLKLHSFSHVTEEILVLRQLIGGSTPVVLDFGCYWGKWGSMALAHGCDVYGVDVNDDAAAFCAGRGFKMAAPADLKDSQFDFINVDQVIEHLAEPLGVVRMLASKLKPGGILKLGTPDEPRLPGLLRRAQESGNDELFELREFDGLAPLVHVNLFSNKSLKLLGAEVGLRVMKLPFWKWLGAGQLWNLPRQMNRNIRVPWKRWRGAGTHLWFRKAA